MLTTATGYRGFDQKPDTPQPQVNERVSKQLDAALVHSFPALSQRHVADYEKLFLRVSLKLGTSSAASQPSAAQPTDQRLANFAAVPDPSLLALYFQYGRYLLISSSRPGTQAANLQGIWSYQVQPPWSSNWTANINVQMNYWLAETCNLSDCTEPLFTLIEGLSHTGARAAQETYGLPGWVTHHNIDIWRAANPVGMGVGSPTWANWAMSGLRWSRLFGQFSAIPKWKSLFSVWPPGGSGGRLKFTGSAMLPSFPYRLTGRVSLSQADCSR